MGRLRGASSRRSCPARLRGRREDPRGDDARASRRSRRRGPALGSRSRRAYGRRADQAGPSSPRQAAVDSARSSRLGSLQRPEVAVRRSPSRRPSRRTASRRRARRGKRAKVMAEEKGVEGSGKAGRGQFWRAAREGDEAKMQSGAAGRPRAAEGPRDLPLRGSSAHRTAPCGNCPDRRG